MLQILKFLALIILIVILAGCAKYEPPSYFINYAVDANKDGVIDGKDIPVLEANAKDCFDTCIVAVCKKAGIELKTEQDMDTPANIDILEGILTIAEGKKLTIAKDDLKKIRRQMNDTQKYVETGKDKKPRDSGIVRGLAYCPDRLICVLDDGRFVLLIGIGIPTHTSRYRKMSEDMFYKLTLNKAVNIDYDTVKSTGDYSFAYVYIDDVFVNEEMVSKGYARAKPTTDFTTQNNKYDSLFKQLEKEAKENKRGIWALTDDF